MFRVDGQRGPRWYATRAAVYAKYQLPDGRQVQKALGLSWMKVAKALVRLGSRGRWTGPQAEGRRGAAAVGGVRSGQ
jgi:hypothetical protein